MKGLLACLLADPDCVVKNTQFGDGRWYTRDCAGARPAVCECER